MRLSILQFDSGESATQFWPLATRGYIRNAVILGDAQLTALEDGAHSTFADLANHLILLVDDVADLHDDPPNGGLA